MLASKRSVGARYQTLLIQIKLNPKVTNTKLDGSPLTFVIEKRKFRFSVPRFFGNWPNNVSREIFVAFSGGTEKHQPMKSAILWDS